MLNALISYINDNYGSKRGLLAHGKFYCLHRLGYLQELKDIDFTRVDCLVFVCMGNICRSPIGEYYARRLGLSAKSYGLRCRGGDPADPRAVRYGKKLGLDLSSHVTRPIGDYRPSANDLVVAMEPGQAEELQQRYRSNVQITLANLWLKSPNLYLHDPFSATTNYFDRCGNRIVEAAESLGNAIR